MCLRFLRDGAGKDWELVVATSEEDGCSSCRTGGGLPVGNKL